MILIITFILLVGCNKQNEVTIPEQKVEEIMSQKIASVPIEKRREFLREKVQKVFSTITLVTNNFDEVHLICAARLQFEIETELQNIVVPPMPKCPFECTMNTAGQAYTLITNKVDEIKLRQYQKACSQVDVYMQYKKTLHHYCKNCPLLIDSDSSYNLFIRQPEHRKGELLHHINRILYRSPKWAEQIK